MVGPLIGIGGIAYILIFAELIRAAKLLRHAEMLRKFVHILTGIFAASWAFFMPFYAIQILSVILLVAVIVSLRLSIFQSVHGVSRQTYGELLFPIGIFVVASLTKSDWVYAAAILHLGLADGLAAMIGMQRARRFRYKIGGQSKSLLGSATFYMVSVAIIASTLWLSPIHLSVASFLLLLWLPIATTCVESIAIFGTDNLLVPLLIVLALNSL